MAPDESQAGMLVVELAALLRARHPASLEHLELPLLRRLAEREARPVPDVVLGAIERMADPRTRHAARELVPLPFGTRIAPTLTDRRINAARSFGQSGNYFRSGPSDRSKPSTESLVLQAIATAILEGGGDSPGQPGWEPVDLGLADDATSSTPEMKPDGAHRTSGRGGRDGGAAFWALLVASLVLVVPVVWIVATRSAEGGPDENARSSPERRPSDGCRHSLGSGFLRTEFRNALRAARADATCPVGDMEMFEDMAFQRVVGGGDNTWVVLRRPDGGILAFPWTAWERYRTVAEAGIVMDGFGLPVAWKMVSGRAELRLDGGLTIASEHRHGLYFLVHPDIDRLWRARSDELGPPYSSAMTTSRQHFAGGYVELTGGVAAWVPVSAADAERALPPSPDRREAILTQPSGIAWWVDGADRRWLIRSDRVKRCLGGEDAVVDDEVPGYAIAQLELGGVAGCALAPG